MDPIKNSLENVAYTDGSSAFIFNDIKKYKGLTGRIMEIFGLVVKVKDDSSGRIFYIKAQDLVKKFVGEKQVLSKNGKYLLCNRILEVTNEDSRRPLSSEKLKTLFIRFVEDKKTDPSFLETEDGILREMDKLKNELSGFNKIHYVESLEEVVGSLRPGDFLIRKYHETHSNLICDVQNFFHLKGYRESHKCSHIAVYLGEINGKFWVAEAAWPNEKDAEIRRVEISDPRFALKEKNQYLVIRNRDEQTASAMVKLARKYTVIVRPESEKEPNPSEISGSIRYTIIEAARSIWHSSKLNFFGKQRLLKFYADYKNAIPFEYFGNTRGHFCSHFAFTMEAISEMNDNTAFQSFLEKHPIPVKYDESKRGVALKVSKLWYSARKGVWARWLAIRYKQEVQKAVSTQLDPLRTSPQSAVQYLLDHKDRFKVVGLVNRQNDFE